MGSNLAALIEFLRFLIFNKKISEKFGKNENNIVCAEFEKVL